VLGGGSSGSQGGGRIREQGAAGFQPSQGLAQNRQHFAASLLHGAGGLRAVDGGRDRLLSVRQVADRLGVCTATVYTLCDRNELAHVRVLNALRIAPADLARFIAAARRGG
jgi:excisionase family DNA binding protein